MPEFDCEPQPPGPSAGYVEELKARVKAEDEAEQERCWREHIPLEVSGSPSSPTLSEVEAETRAAVERIKRDHRTGELGGED